MHYACSKEWRTKHPEQRRPINTRAIARKPEYYRALKKHCHYKWREKLRYLVFDHYSSHTFKCACCGGSELDFLVIDHIGGRGNEHRRTIFGQINAGGHRMHRWLVREHFPEGFQLLCANCNTSRGKHGACIHERATTAPSRPIPEPASYRTETTQNLITHSP